MWSVSLQQVSFGEHFNQPIVGTEWPASLRQLRFGNNFDQPIVEVDPSVRIVRASG